MPKTIAIASVGTSAITSLMQQAIAAVPGVVCQVVCSRDEARGREFVRSAGVPEHASDYRAVLERPDIDAVYIASPNRFHLEQALQALEHKKHVILEKPAAVRRGDAERLVQAAEEQGVFFFEAISTLFMPNYLALRALLPRLGRVSQADICYGQYSSKYDAYLRGENPNIFNPEMEAGALNDMGVYCVHVAVDLFGPPETVDYQGEYGPNGIDLAGRLLLGYRDFTCQVRTAKNRDLDSGCLIQGEGGWLKSAGPLNEFPAAQVCLEGETQEIQRQQGLENRLIFELSRFRDAILEADRDFFQRMARQSALTASVLEAAHAGAKK